MNIITADVEEFSLLNTIFHLAIDTKHDSIKSVLYSK
jgi:hypothetical protein